jgi:flagellin
MRLTCIVIPAFIIITSLNTAGKDNSFLFKPDNANFFVYGYGRNSFIINQSKLAGLKLDSQISQLSSGKRINSASDDPAGLAVAEKMKSLLDQLKQESMNSEDMRNFHNFIESAIAQDQEILQRIRLLTVQASNGILNNEDRGYIQAEIDQFLSQINFNAKFLQFNKIGIIPELTAQNLGLDKVDVIRNLQNSIGIVDEALKKLIRKRVLQGVKSNILTFQIEGKNYQYLNLQRTESLIRDLDMAEGITNLIKNSVLLKSQYGLVIRSK